MPLKSISPDTAQFEHVLELVVEKCNKCGEELMRAELSAAAKRARISALFRGKVNLADPVFTGEDKAREHFEKSVGRMVLSARAALPTTRETARGSVPKMRL